jgi:hypothetical protein
MTSSLAASILLIALPIAFNTAFAGLAKTFDYPDILRRPTGEILARFRKSGAGLVLLWWGFAGAILVVCSLEFVGPFERTGWKLAATLTPFTYIAWSLWLIVVGVALLL